MVQLFERPRWLLLDKMFLNIGYNTSVEGYQAVVVTESACGP